ncbi:MAG: DinB family protein [candidate division Zixibacteria bacterium]|nr:DinB family protein [candidate division Zixibacteria bacterium]
MITSIKEFTEYWQNHSKATQKLLAALTDQSLSQKVSESDRTLARIAWHIVLTIPEMVERTGLKLNEPAPSASLPRTAQEILKGYNAVAGSLLEQVEKFWDDSTLQIEDNMYGQQWKRGLTLEILIDHEIHHRGQMTVLMRQAGLKVPGLFGPSREEWAEFGGSAPEI